MNRILFILLLFTSLISVQAQIVDTVIDMGVYKSHYSFDLKSPLFVEYTLFKGGGNCSRVGFKFKNIGLKNEANSKDYEHNGYDEGHLANAADFGFDCKKEELTFRYINCLPQTPRLNRGIWKTWETKIRKESQADTLLVYCGGAFEQCGFIGNHVAVPKFCWKVVKSSKGKLLHVLWFSNDNSDSVKEITIEDLYKKLSYKIEL